MQRRLVTLFTLVTLLLLSSACGLLREPAAPSAPLEAVPLEADPPEEVESTAASEEQGGADATDTPVETAAEETSTAEPVVAEAAESTEGAPTAETTAAEEAETAGSSERRIYTISAADSQVRFELDEDLRGQRTTVVGSTDQVAGQIGFDLADLSTAEVGVIQINARTLLTDNNFRNRAIQNEILDTGGFEFITFTPTAVDGLPDNAGLGDEVAFTVAGDLTIRDVTQPVIFDVVAVLRSEDELVGTATTTVSREAYGLRIPDVPSVANVEDEVDLTIDFVATG